jgi:hypothetical protein
VYDRGRYFVMTGQHIHGMPLTVEERQPQLELVLAEYLPATDIPVAPAPQPVALDDQELLDRAFQARNGVGFRRLHDGDHSGYSSRSEADLAYCSTAAFWTGRDPVRIDAWFRASGLMREKWERPDYRERTIAAAIAGTTDVYTAPQQRAKFSRAAAVGGSDGTTSTVVETPEFRLEVQTAAALTAQADAETDLLLGPLVEAGKRTIVLADSGHGKTTLTQQMLAGILTGGDVLGYEGAEVGPVLIVDLEQGLKSIRRGLREPGLADRKDVLVVSVPDGLALDRDPAHLAELDRVIGEHRPVAVALDPYYKAHAVDDPNAERPVVDLMRILDQLRARHGFALILPAHPRKDVPGRNGARKLTLHDVAGSGAVVRGAEVVLGIERLGHGYARLRILKDRDGDLPVGEAWQLIFSRDQGFRLDPKEQKSDEEIETTIAARAQAGDLLTVKEWAAELAIRQRRAKETLDRMAAAGRIDVVVGPPGRSPKAHCYGTAPAGWEQSGAVEPSLLDSSTAPTAPTSIGDVGSGSSEASALPAGTVREQSP